MITDSSRSLRVRRGQDRPMTSGAGTSASPAARRSRRGSSRSTAALRQPERRRLAHGRRHLARGIVQQAADPRRHRRGAHGAVRRHRHAEHHQVSHRPGQPEQREAEPGPAGSARACRGLAPSARSGIAARQAAANSIWSKRQSVSSASSAPVAAARPRVRVEPSSQGSEATRISSKVMSATGTARPETSSTW